MLSDNLKTCLYLEAKYNTDKGGRISDSCQKHKVGAVTGKPEGQALWTGSGALCLSGRPCHSRLGTPEALKSLVAGEELTLIPQPPAVTASSPLSLLSSVCRNQEVGCGSKEPQ